MYKWYGKRALDIVIALIILALTLIPMALIALTVVLDSKGPAFFVQKRVGRDKRHFMIYKFRTMRTDTPVDAAKHIIQDADSYITRVGRFLRASSLDELPQVINILKGDMSFIGPRPALWNQFDLIAERDRYAANGVRPGLSGLAQVMGRDELDVPEKARLDGMYVKDLSFSLDARIFIKTFVSVASMDGYLEGGTPAHARTDTPPLVSVVVSTWRRDETLARALDTLIAQTWPHMQVVLVDDNADAGWNKRVKSIAEEKAEKGLSLIRIVNDKNLGSARARNAGILAAQGEYVTFLDDDDLYLPGKVEHQLQAMLDDGADYCVTDLMLMTENGVSVGMRSHEYLVGAHPDDLMRLHMIYHIGGTDSFMFKKSYLVSIGMFEAIDVGDDFYLMTRAIQVGGRMLYLPECEARGTVHTKTDSLSSGDKKIEGEKLLYEYKRKYSKLMSDREIRYMRMHHFITIAYTEMRRRHYSPFIVNAARGFFAAPVACVKYVTKRLLSRHR